VRYEQEETFDEATEVAEKKKVGMEEIPWPNVQSTVKVVHFSIEIKSQKYPKVNSYMELAME
jgi:hypothetical protein